MDDSQRNMKYSITLFLIACLLSVISGVSLAEESEQADHRLNRDFMKAFALDIRAIATSPGKWDKKDISWISTCLATGIFIYIHDDEIQQWVSRNKGTTSKAVAPYIRCLGKGACLSLILAVLYGSGELFQKPGLRETALMGLESWVISGGIVWCIKVLAGRARPLTGHDSFSFHPFSFVSRYHSLPSGDASSAFAVASVIAASSGSFIINALSYSLAALVALTRVHDDKHWLSDVFLGSVIGYVVGKKIVSLHRSRKAPKISVCFQAAGGYPGMGLRVAF